VQSSLRLADKDALIALYHSTAGSMHQWHRSDGWENLLRNRLGSGSANDDVACIGGALYGVTCSHMGEVTSIRLPHNNLRGSIPSAIWSMPQLQVLNVSGNDLSGHLGEPELALIQTAGLMLNSISTAGNSMTIGPGICNEQRCSDLSALSSSAHHACEANDRAVLMELFNTSTHSPWLRRSGWGSPTDACQWEGVRCDVAGRVTQLLLAANGITGHLTSSIRRLEKLQVLDMQDNRLFGYIEPDVQQLLATLPVVHMQGNWFWRSGSYDRGLVPCPKGRFGVFGVAPCFDCLPGRFGAREGLSDGLCSGVCDAGYFCPEGSTSKRMQGCSPGSFCPQGAGTQFECGGTQHFCPSNSSSPQSVAEGYYSIPEGGTKLRRTGQRRCGEGAWCEDGIRHSLLPPDASAAHVEQTFTTHYLMGGTDASSRTESRECEAGKYCVHFEAYECEMGWACPGNGSRYPCEEGFFSHAQGLKKCSACPVHTHPDRPAGAIECVLCPKEGMRCMPAEKTKFEVHTHPPTYIPSHTSATTTTMKNATSQQRDNVVGGHCGQLVYMCYNFTRVTKKESAATPYTHHSLPHTHTHPPHPHTRLTKVHHILYHQGELLASTE
jgi:hypothetical protein